MPTGIAGSRDPHRSPAPDPRPRAAGRL